MKLFTRTSASACGVILAGVHVLFSSVGHAQSVRTASDEGRQLLADAWWTGPILANSADTLPRGHFLIEPYFYAVHGTHANTYGSSTYLIYGLSDRLTVGLIPIAGFNTADKSPNSSNMGVGDLSLVAQLGVTKYHEGDWIPSTAIYLQKSIPTGKYDHLGTHRTDGFGSGAFTTKIALNSQEYCWLPNGRILRVRLNLAGMHSTTADVQDVSVYGTPQGFSGKARPGPSFISDLAFEYSVTRRWVLALDLTYSYSTGTMVTGRTIGTVPTEPSRRLSMDSGSAEAFGFVPAIEYNWRANAGIIAGVRLIRFGHDTPPSITPVVAINLVY